MQRRNVQSLFGDINFTLTHSLRGFPYIWSAILQIHELSYKAGPPKDTTHWVGVGGGTPPSVGVTTLIPKTIRDLRFIHPQAQHSSLL